MHRNRVAALLCACALLACDDEADREAAEAAADSAQVVESAEEVRDMLSPLRAVGLAEVEFSDMAGQRAARPDVRQYARVVAADHRALIAALDSVARKHDTTLAETQAAGDLSGSVRIAHAGLDGMEGAEFDLAFIRAEVESHRQLLDAMDQQVLPGASSPPMREFLADTRAMVHAHLTRARQLLAMLLGQTLEPEGTTNPTPAAPPGGAPPQQVPPPAAPPVNREPPPDTIPAAAGGVLSS